MNITDDQLTTADWETLFTKDPSRFIESIIINILYADETASPEDTINRQRRVFEKWLALYNGTYRETIAKSVSAHYANREAQVIAEAEKRGRIAALSNLPLKKSLLNRQVDLDGVTTILRELKGKKKESIKT